ncbi:phospholipase D1-like isoform X1 [Mytilus edulis]|uniref:phospholipase D1-like isoform X1 n=1 Tax=Mytilus edulis TaxID=6550 RepID=UPI0039F0FEBF
MATATESAPLVERAVPTIRFADDSIDLNVPEPDSPTSTFSGNSFNSYFPEFLRSHSFASDQDSDFDELDGLPDVEFPECHGFDVTDGENHAAKEIPFKAVHTPSVPFGTIRRNCWIQGIPIQVKITSYERHQAHIKIFSPYLYTIAIKHGEFEWTIRRRYKHFTHLHQQLQLYKAKCSLPMPTKSQRRRRQSVKGTRNKIPRFPKKPELMARDMEKRKNYLEDYLQNLVNINVYRSHHETLKFFEVSQLSFVKKLGKKWREGAIRKCSGGRRISIGCCGCLKKFHFAGNWKKRWLVVKDSFVAYIRPRDGLVCDVMLMDTDFKIETGMGATGAPHGLLISNLSRNLLAKCWTSRKAEEWKASIETAVSTGMGKDYTTKNRFNSFAPVRENSYAKWFIDGCSYFSAVAEALESAKEEIFITDWWLSPEIYLKRHTMDWNRWRLDKVLERKAKEGVKIFILLYKEMSVALNISSIYSKHILSKACPENIKILRHPDHGAGGVLLWAHHEKIVCVDQKVAFLGGIDLCYGRWDDAQHKLTDLGCVIYDHGTSVQVNGQAVTGEDNNEGITICVTPPSPNRHKDLFTPNEFKSSPNQTDNQEPCVCSGHIADRPHGYAYANDTEESTADINQEDAYKHSDSVIPNILEIDVPSGNCDYNSEDEGGDDGTMIVNQQEVSVTVHEVDSQQSNDEKLRNIVNYMQNQAFASKAKAVIQKNAQTTSNCSKVQEDKISQSEHKEDEKNHLIRQEEITEDTSTADGIPRPKSAKEFRMELEKNKKQKLKNNSSENKKDEGRKSKTKSKISEHGIVEKGFKKLEEDLPVFIDPNEQPLKKIRNDSGEVQMRKKLPSPMEVKETSTKVTASRESWAKKKLRTSLSKAHSKEDNNNKDTPHDGEEEVDEHIRKRWRLVLNVQKFESTLQRPQKIAGFPESKKQPLSSKISSKIKDRIRHERKDSLDGIKEELDYLDTPAILHKTSSEMKIDELGLVGSSKMWIGKDYVNFIYKDFVDLHDPFEDFIDRTQTPRMPWHDIGGVVYGKAARDVARHFIGRWNMTKVEKAKNNRNFPLLVPKGYTPHNLVPQVIRDQCDEVKSQILRSAGGWSCGIQKRETSIQTAYLHCIESAKHYIYIENQFFITYIGDHAVVKNEIGEALFKRIVRAHRNNETFRIYVVMPLLPAFEGEIGKSGAYAIKAITHYNYTSICKGPQSLWHNLGKEGIEPLNYITFCGLRTHTELNGKLVSELVYVHSKLMIVDDDTVIMGSANINDRSMLGDRDSEIAVMFQDIHKHKVKMNGVEHMAGKFASSMRKNLFREHLGIDPLDNTIDLSDPVNDVFYKNFYLSVATVNTGIYEKVFRCLPNNQVLSFNEADAYMQEKSMAETDPATARQELKRVRGYLVLMPLKFLDNENSIIPFGGREAILPVSVWV